MSGWEKHGRQIRLALWGISGTLFLGGLVGLGVAATLGVEVDPNMILNWVAITESPSLIAALASSLGSPGHWVAEGYRRGLEDRHEGDPGGEVRPIRR